MTKSTIKLDQELARLIMRNIKILTVVEPKTPVALVEIAIGKLAAPTYLKIVRACPDYTMGRTPDGKHETVRFLLNFADVQKEFPHILRFCGQAGIQAIGIINGNGLKDKLEPTDVDHLYHLDGKLYYCLTEDDLFSDFMIQSTELVRSALSAGLSKEKVLEGLNDNVHKVGKLIETSGKPSVDKVEVNWKY